MATTSATPLELEPRRPGRGVSACAGIGAGSPAATVVSRPHRLDGVHGSSRCHRRVHDCERRHTSRRRLEAHGLGDVTRVDARSRAARWGSCCSDRCGDAACRLVVQWPPGTRPTSFATMRWFCVVSILSPASSSTPRYAVTRDSGRRPGYYLVAFVLSFVARAELPRHRGLQAYLRRFSLLRMTREASLVPLLSAQLFSGVLTMISVYVAIRTGTSASPSSA